MTTTKGHDCSRPLLLLQDMLLGHPALLAAATHLTVALGWSS